MRTSTVDYSLDDYGKISRNCAHSAIYNGSNTCPHAEVCTEYSKSLPETLCSTTCSPGPQKSFRPHHVQFITSCWFGLQNFNARERSPLCATTLLFEYCSTRVGTYGDRTTSNLVWCHKTANLFQPCKVHGITIIEHVFGADFEFRC